MIARLTIGPSEFFFHHVLHAEATRRSLPSPSPAVMFAGGLLFGRRNLQVLVHHDEHHRHMRVGAARLPLIAARAPAAR